MRFYCNSRKTKISNDKIPASPINETSVGKLLLYNVARNRC